MIFVSNNKNKIFDSSDDFLEGSILRGTTEDVLACSFALFQIMHFRMGLPDPLWLVPVPHPLPSVIDCVIVPQAANGTIRPLRFAALMKVPSVIDASIKGKNTAI